MRAQGYACVPELPAEERDAYVRRVSACEGLLNLGAQVVRTTAHMLAAVARPRAGAPRAERERGPFDQLCQLQRRVLWQLALAEEWRRAGGGASGAARAGSDAEAAGGAGQAAGSPAAGGPLAPAGSGEAAGAADAAMEPAPGGAGGAEGAPGDELAAAGAEDRWALGMLSGSPQGRKQRDDGKLGPPVTGMLFCTGLHRRGRASCHGGPACIPRIRLAQHKGTSSCRRVQPRGQCFGPCSASVLARGHWQGTVLACVTARRATTHGRHMRITSRALVGDTRAGKPRRPRRARARRDAADPAAAAAAGRRGKKSGADLAQEVLQHFAVAARAFLTACAKVRARAAPPRNGRAAAAGAAPGCAPVAALRRAATSARWYQLRTGSF